MRRRAAAVNQLRRMCTPKPHSGALDVPKEVAAQFRKKGDDRNELINIYLDQCNGDKVGHFLGGSHFLDSF